MAIFPWLGLLKETWSGSENQYEPKDQWTSLSCLGLGFQGPTMELGMAHRGLNRLSLK